MKKLHYFLLAPVIFWSLEGFSQGQMMRGLLLGPKPHTPELIHQTRARVVLEDGFEADIEQHPETDTEVSRQQISVFHSYRMTEEKKWDFFTTIEKFRLASNGVPNTVTTDFPRPLWDLKVGAAHHRKRSDGSKWVVSGFLGSPSDQPFSGSSSTVLNLNGMYQFAANENNSSWLLFVNLNTNRNFANGIPLPGFGYLFGDPDTFRMIVGAPFLALNWNISEKWSLFSYYFPVVRGMVNLSYRLMGPFKIYTQFESRSDRYILENRSTSRERWFYNRMSGSLGFRAPVLEGVFLDASGGVEFNRHIDQSEDFHYRRARATRLKESGFIKFAFNLDL